MPGSDRHHGIKRKSNTHHKQPPAGAKHVDAEARLQQTPSTASSSSSSSSSSSKHKRRKHATRAPPADPPLISIKPLVEYDDISSDSDGFLDPPGPPERPAGTEDDQPYVTEIRSHKRHRSRKKSKDPHRVRESAQTAERKSDAKDGKRKSKDKPAISAVNCRSELEAPTRRLESSSSLLVNQGSESSVNKDSQDSHRKSHRAQGSSRDKTERTRERSERSRGKSSKNRKSGFARVPSSSQPDPDDGYSARRRATTPSPYRDSSRRSRQRSESPYTRRRSSSYERDASPYGSRRSPSASPPPR